MKARRSTQLGKMLLLFMAFCFTMIPTVVFAHTGLEQSTPKDGETVEDVNEITLTFESKVEKGSSFTLMNEKGEVVPVDSIQINNQVMSGSVPSTISDGPYTVNWKIIGADGHPIEGKFSFQVKGNKTETQPTSQNQTTTLATPKPAVTPEPSVAQTPVSSVNSNSYTILWIAVVIFVIVIVCIGLILRKKGK
ncbi:MULTISPECIES: copper resistance CopC family protein [Brevibacillus]|uniref:copper resistance CopC family protein n=1 Tax=Brevibacillus TaxID=55080 RepID=UPI0011688BEE|nr:MULTISPECIES: copper resistance CopC family protein [Brevibacillus]MCM3080548.1 copper resistance protein CopC [Brevibacillus invocatus]MCM3430689.1 copper resistance protein CopC [Brevibacillus invocatus]MEC2133469.1 copper resistance protein CopC [Brevibacillus centrosporus]GED34899.1 hypothetical protein BCE02nite_60400 [Brevibacillus centrosporus]